MSRERELLQRALECLETTHYFDKIPIGGKAIEEEIRAHLASEEIDTSPEPKPPIGARLPNGAVVTNVYEAYEEGLRQHLAAEEGKEEDEPMIETKFTPGPWHIGYGKTVESLGGGDFFAIGFKTDPDWTAICLLSPADSVSNIDKANAHLIAAAPELYEALEELYAEQNGPPLEKYKTSWEKAIRKTEAALAKARGEA